MHHRHNMLSPALLVPALFMVAPLAGCTVGPDYKGPPPVASTAEKAASFQRAADAGVIVDAPAAQWWTALGDQQLDALIQEALANSPDVDAAEARLRAARAALRQSRRDLLPSVSAQGTYLRTDGGSLTGAFSGGEDNDDGSGQNGDNGQQDSGDSTFELYNVGFDATWEIDIFGGKRRASEAARAQAEASAANLADVHVSLAAEVAQAYVDLRDQQQRLQLARDSAAKQQQILTLIQQRRQYGAASDLDVERQQTELATARATEVPLAGQVKLSLDRLALLLGREPGAMDSRLAAPAPLPQLPATVPVGNPADMLRRRPDIRAAERTLAARNAVIGQRVADMFPKVTLLGILGWGSTSISSLFDSDNLSYIAAPMLQWNFLDFGRNQARVREAEANRDEAIANYRKAVLTALNDAESSLSRFGSERQNLVNLARVRLSAQRAATLTRQRRNNGVASEIEALDTERTLISADQNLASAQATLVKDFIALQKSLGLGWAPPLEQR